MEQNKTAKKSDGKTSLNGNKRTTKKKNYLNEENSKMQVSKHIWMVQYKIGEIYLWQTGKWDESAWKVKCLFSSLIPFLFHALKLTYSSLCVCIWLWQFPIRFFLSFVLNLIFCHLIQSHLIKFFPLSQ